MHEATSIGATGASRIHSLDWLRLAAVAMVVVTHALSIQCLNQHAVVFGYRIGGLGTSLFLVISGLLAQGSTKTPAAWLYGRLLRIFPVYWIVVIGGFCLSYASGYKAFDSWQVVCQLLGIGAFTHPGRLINVSLWFISIVLIGSLLIVVARFTSKPKVVVAFLVFTCLVHMWLAQGFPHQSSLVSFLIGYLLPLQSTNRRTIQLSMLGILFAWMAGLMFPELRHLYLALSLVFLVTKIQIPYRPWPPLVNASYEFYLVHGICLIGMQRLAPSFWPFGLLAAMSISMALAWQLNRWNLPTVLHDKISYCRRFLDANWPRIELLQGNASD